MERNVVHFLPILTTGMAAAFFLVLWRHWKGRRARYLLWWSIGIGLYGLGTATEAFTSIFGWNEGVFRLWYLAGAILGAAPLAQGTVYLLLQRAKADRLALALVGYMAIAAGFIVSTPVNSEMAETYRLSGVVMEWQWVRLFSPIVNLYAVVFLIGGALWSAWAYRRDRGSASRVRGNVLIAIGAILPGIGGSYARLGHVEVLYVTELVGLALVWAGYRLIVGGQSPSIHGAQRTLAVP